jgi:hypothetical protein
MRKRWPADPEFRRFAARLADAVQFAFAMDHKLAPYKPYENAWNENCPLGCLTGSKHPTFSSYTGLELRDHLAFVAGFDRGKAERNPYNRLGRAYRERFVK